MALAAGVVGRALDESKNSDQGSSSEAQGSTAHIGGRGGLLYLEGCAFYLEQAEQVHVNSLEVVVAALTLQGNCRGFA